MVHFNANLEQLLLNEASLLKLPFKQDNDCVQLKVSLFQIEFTTQIPSPLSYAFLHQVKCRCYCIKDDLGWIS
jgi:hypothetical protein